VDLTAYAVEGVRSLADLTVGTSAAGVVFHMPDGASVTFADVAPVASDFLFG
jgi:hypothetical protein